MMARLSGKRARHRGLTASLAATVAAVAVLAAPGVATATPPTPTITASQDRSLTMQLKSDTGTHWSWTFLNAAAAVVGTSTLQEPAAGVPAGRRLHRHPGCHRRRSGRHGPSPRPDDLPRVRHPDRRLHLHGSRGRNRPVHRHLHGRADQLAVEVSRRRHIQPAQSPATADRRRKPAPAGGAYGGQPGRESHRDPPGRRERSSLRCALDHAEPHRSEHPGQVQCERVDRSQRGCAQLLVGPQRRPDVRRRRRADPDASLCRARHAQGGSEGDRRPWWHRHGRRLRDRSPGQAAHRRVVGEPGPACGRRDRDLHRGRSGPGRDGRRDPMGPRRRRAVRRRHGRRRDVGLQHARVEDRGRAGGGQHGCGDDRLSNDRRDGVDGDPTTTTTSTAPGRGARCPCPPTQRRARD